MIYLADTSVLIYLATGSSRIPASVRKRLEPAGCVVYASAVSAFEIGNKHRIGKLPHVEEIVAGFAAWAARVGFTVIGLTAGEASTAAAFPCEHRDPFDRCLAAQSLSHRAPILSPDPAFDAFGVERIW